VDYLGRRIKYKGLSKKIVQAEEAIGALKTGMTVGISSDIFAICNALERRAIGENNLRIQIWSSMGYIRADRTFPGLDIIQKRIGQQIFLKKEINSQRIEYLDTPLGFFYQSIRAGEFGNLDLAIIEAVGITEDGNLIPSYRVSDMPNFANQAKQVIIQLNTYYPLEFEGMHDIFLPQNPPQRKIIPITRVDDRIGTPYIPLNPEKIKYIVPSEVSETIDVNERIDEASIKISANLLAFLRQEVSKGRLPQNLLPIEIGLGSIPSAVLSQLKNSCFEGLEFYSAILDDKILDLIDSGKVRAVSCSQMLLSHRGEEKLLKNLDFYKRYITLRPIEITDCPEIIMRLGLLALNGAIEVDIYGHVNSSHITSGDVISGIGGVSEFAMNAYLSVILLPSITKNGKVSCIVPMVSHVDIPEHGVDVIVTEQGVADLRGLTPRERAEKIIEFCAHPIYKPFLRKYFEKAKENGGGHEPHEMEEALSFHQRFLRTGSMKV
jgi:succinyl-CoA:acetate CoA-transferase